MLWKSSLLANAYSITDSYYILHRQFYKTQMFQKRINGKILVLVLLVLLVVPL